MRCLVAATSVTVGGPALGDEAWHFRDWEKGSAKICSMYQYHHGHSIAVLFARLPRERDSGIVSLVFGDQTLLEPAKAKQAVQLEFDTATVRGYRLELTSFGPEVRMVTNALTNLFLKFERATRLDVVSSSARISYELAGFAAALDRLRSCTGKHRL